LSLIGTFLVRSGVLTSVHAFATDPERGRFILCILLVAIGGALGLFAWRAPKLESGAAFEPVSRETAILLNNVLLTAAAATVFLGTLYPLFLEAATGTRISVGPPYFAITFAPLFVALVVIAPFGPRLAWRRDDLLPAMRALAPGLGVAILGAAIVLAVATPHAAAAACCVALAGWVLAASVIDLAKRAKSNLLSLGSFAPVLAHAGLGLTLLGIAGTTLWKSEALEVLAPGQALEVVGYRLRFDGVTPIAGPNYRADRATIEVMRNDEKIATLGPEKRIYPVEGQAISKTAIRTTGISDLYVALGDDRGQGRYAIRAYVNPLAPFIWFGGAAMALGGLTSLLSRIRLGLRRQVLAPAE
jgi:cytochrome c-type biogenesis protein CcmF